MFKRFEQLAEQVATDVSRRNFFGWLGRCAVTSAMFAAAVLAPASDVEAATLCNQNSAGACRGKPAGASCRVGRYSGTCVAAPACYCKLAAGVR